MSNLLNSPPHISLINLDAFLSPNSTDKGSIPLSNLNLASVTVLGQIKLRLSFCHLVNAINVFLLDRTFVQRIPIYFSRYIHHGN